MLRRPDVFHAGVAGAPATDWRLYDTHYTERYLGDPARDPAPTSEARSSMIRNGPGRLARPLLIIHGLADDNVFVAHSLRLSSALLAAGYPHSVLPLSGVTHMTSQEVVAENMLLLQVAFLKQALGLSGGTGLTGSPRVAAQTASTEAPGRETTEGPGATVRAGSGDCRGRDRAARTRRRRGTVVTRGTAGALGSRERGRNGSKAQRPR